MHPVKLIETDLLRLELDKDFTSRDSLLCFWRDSGFSVFFVRRDQCLSLSATFAPTFAPTFATSIVTICRFITIIA